MRTARFLLTLFGCGALVHGLGFALPPSRVPNQGGAPPVRKERSPLHPGQPAAKPAPGSRTLPATGRGNVRQPGSPANKAAPPYRPTVARAASAAKDGLAPKLTARQTNRLALPPAASQLTTLQARPLHNRAPAPATLGGRTLASAARNTAALSGTGMRRKP